MALVILSTIASALSISGKGRYICGSNEVGKAKSLRSDNGLRVGSLFSSPDGTYINFNVLMSVYK